MIIELRHEADDKIGRFQAPAVPRIEEKVHYDQQRYTVVDVRWLIEEAHNQNVDIVQVVVTEIEDEEEI